MLYHMNYYNTHSPFFVSCYTSNVEQYQKIDKFLDLLSRSGTCEIIKNAIKKTENKGGIPKANPYNLFAAIVFCFAFKKNSLREIESEIKFDLRIKYIMQNEEPTYKTIGNFINEIIKPNQEDIFAYITKQIFIDCNISMNKMFIDGSKFEANANKYKFVWKPTTFHIKLTNKIRLLLEKYNLSRTIPKQGILDSKTIAFKYSELSKLFSKYDLSLKENKKYLKDIKLLEEYLSKSLEYEEKERICGPNRNSYFKTDIDSTAMCLKEDYYSGLGSNMHAAYNTQISVSLGFITCYYISQSRNDLYDFIPIIDRFHSFYNNYPTSICADSGYGSELNYDFMNKHNIKSFVKYVTWEVNASGRNPSQYILNEDETITCLNGNKGYTFENKNTKSKVAIIVILNRIVKDL